MGSQERKSIISQLEKVRESRVLCCVTSDREGLNAVIAKDFIPVFFEHLRTFGGSKRIDVFMFTNGGDTLAAFGLSRLVRSFTKDGRFGVFVPEKCYSAGTLFLLGADEIVMAQPATLSPIDPSVASPLAPTVEVQPGQRTPLTVSVESVRGFFSLAKDDWHLSDAGLSAAFQALTEKIHPIVLGDIYRSTRQIERLAAMLLETHVKDEELIKTVVRKLTRELGSHDYLISRDEATSLLKGHIVAEDSTRDGLIWQLYEDYRKEMELGKPYVPAIEIAAAKNAGRSLPAKITQQVIFIESTTKSDLFRRDILLSERTVPTPAGPVSLPFHEAFFNGWTT